MAISTKLINETIIELVGEDALVIVKFLKNKKDFSLITPEESFKKFIKNENFLRTFPHIHKMDGSFAAILKRNQ